MPNMKGLELAVSELRVQRTSLVSQLKQVDAALSVLGKLENGGSGRPGRRPLSLAARRKIAAAQRARWARVRQQKKAA
jgi:hypothetical protein